MSNGNEISSIEDLLWSAESALEKALEECDIDTQSELWYRIHDAYKATEEACHAVGGWLLVSSPTDGIEKTPAVM